MAGRPCQKERKTIDGHQQNDRLRLSRAVTAFGTTSERKRKGWGCQQPRIKFRAQLGARATVTYPGEPLLSNRHACHSDWPTGSCNSSDHWEFQPLLRNRLARVEQQSFRASNSQRVLLGRPWMPPPKQFSPLTKRTSRVTRVPNSGLPTRA